MKKTICIFEDEALFNLLPLVHTRPAYDLRCGILTLQEKIEHYFKSSKIAFHTRKYLSCVVQERNPKCIVNKFGNENVLLINGRLLIDAKIAKQINNLPADSLLYSPDGSVVAAHITSEKINNLNFENDYLDFNALEGFKKIESGINLLKYAWDFINVNGNEIVNDFKILVKKVPSISPKKFPGVQFKNKKQVFISKDVEIDPFVLIDASQGPVYIGKGVSIKPHTYIQGPVFIGDGTIVKSHTGIYHNTSIGKMCKVGGEVEVAIMHSYSNKQHEGFLGHSYLGSWVNIGASTNTSDLKNNYSNITVMLNGKPIDTKTKFVGLIMADHSKTAINTMFNTGTIVGVSCNIFGAGFPDRFIPSFSWGGSDFLRTYDINKCLEVAKIVTSRRNIALSEAEEKLLRVLFEMTAGERSLKIKS
jgi:UDP-N-acetylglucosamine diphosphorylase / glucose-1-phosphate thymidylyltransferase / UDP-N-acetylgalactosamine diphosphorylase / glucosamine-1-phosphate N-acetyltransferase / galactosamine-1-phosphate N-acetyltransferase